MIKEVMASGKLTVKDLFLFLIYHNYSRLGGKLTGILGLIGVVLSPIFFLMGDKISGIVFAIVALMYLVITPLDFYSKALRQLKSNPVFKNKMTFVFSDEGVRATMFTGVSYLEWDKIIRVIVRKEYFYVYIKESQALIIPKNNFACLDDADILEEYIKDNALAMYVQKRVKEEENASEDL